MKQGEKDPFESMSIFGTLLLMLEFYHFVSHMFILCRVRLLPRKDLVKVRYYFLIDALTVLSVYYYTRIYWWQTIMTVCQFIQHMYYFVFWEKTERAKTVVSWSSLDWIQSEKRRQWYLFETIGTFYDVMVHLVNCFMLCHIVKASEIIFALALTYFLTFTIIYNPRLAWSTPSDIPEWVKKRMAPITS